jgi:hypothetical protein
MHPSLRLPIPRRSIICVHQYASPPPPRIALCARHASSSMHPLFPDASAPLLVMRPYGCIPSLLSLGPLSDPLFVMRPFGCIPSFLRLPPPLLVMRPYGCIPSLPSLGTLSDPLLVMRPFGCIPSFPTHSIRCVLMDASPLSRRFRPTPNDASLRMHPVAPVAWTAL